MLLSKVQCIPSVQILERSHIDWANTTTFSKWSRTLLVFCLLYSLSWYFYAVSLYVYIWLYVHIYVMYTTIHSNKSELSYQIISIYKCYHTYVICLYMYIVRVYIYIYGIIWKNFWPPYACHPSHARHCLGFHQLLRVNLSDFLMWERKQSGQR